jgi:hypothetical protein
MPQDAPLVVGWALDAFVLPALLAAALAAYQELCSTEVI